jgi:NTE family protein
MIDVTGLARSPLFAGLDAAEVELIAQRARPCTFEPGDELCRAGEVRDRCWVITSGLVDVLGASGSALPGEVLARQRRGATVGEVGVILGEPQPETVIASIPTTALELDAGQLGELVQRLPQILVNVLRMQHGRLAHARARSAERELGETVAVAMGPALRGEFTRLLAAARGASPRSVTALDRQFSFAGAMTAAEGLVSAHAAVLLPTALDTATVGTLVREADRVVALAGTADDAEQLGALPRPPGMQAEVEVVLVGEEAIRASRAWPAHAPLRVIRECIPGDGFRLSGADLGWLARHLTRTKLGLALGAGGAKGYAHIGVLQVLEEAGYVVDYVAGSSIGAIVGTYLALGADAAEIEATLRGAFDPPTVAEVFKTSLSGRASGLDVMTRLLRETTDDRTFADTVIPLTVMAVDLSERAPAPLRDGPLWEALLAATALAGVFPPRERDGHRLVDGLALVPVPTGAVVQDGADVTVSVNLISPDTLKSWPGGPPPEPPDQRRRRGVLDNLLEVMDLSQLAESVRHAELADLVIAPRFGPHDWRDFHLADQFLAAGLTAAEEQLPALRSLALPASTDTATQIQGEGIDRADTVRI